MKIISIIESITEFEPWSGAVSIYEELTNPQLEQLDSLLADAYPEGMTDTQFNDILWHDSDWIAELLGFRNWEHLERTNNGDYDPITIQCYNIDWDTDDEECEDAEINLPVRVEFILEDEDEIESYYESKENGDEDDFVADKLSDEYGFCVNSFEYKEE